MQGRLALTVAALLVTAALATGGVALARDAHSSTSIAGPSSPVADPAPSETGGPAASAAPGGMDASAAPGGMDASAAPGGSETSPASGAADAASTGTCSFPFEATDATGTNVTVNEEPRRVVVVGAGATQTMWDIGAKQQVVGLWVSPYTTYLDGAADRPNVATKYGHADVEKVLKQDPDLVLLANVQKNKTAQKLRQAGVTVYKFHAARSLDDVYAKTLLTGRLVGACDGARTTVDGMKRTVQKVREVAARTHTVSTYYPFGGGYAPGPDSFITDVLSTAGAHSIVLDGNYSGVTASGVSGEFVVKEDPQWLVASYTPALTNGTPAPKDALPTTDAIKQTRAWKRDHVVLVNANYLSQPAPRVVRPLVTIAKAIHPDAWAAVNSTTTTTTTTANATNSPATTSTVDTPSAATNGTPGDSRNGSAPGFGAVVALLALAGAAALHRRR